MTQIRVGILTAPEIDVTFHGPYETRGSLHVPLSPDSSFTLRNVKIGKGFHWERLESQTFRGSLQLLRRNGLVTAINIIDLEDYLVSVISSEMAATSHPELLKAHAIISRSWAMRRIMESSAPKHDSRTINLSSVAEDGTEEITRWYDNDGHEDFDVCADDHCQRYQGIARIMRPEVEKAVWETAGIVLCHEGQICDTRFSKSCGGAFETFPTCWADESHPYLAPGRDWPDSPLPDLRNEDAAKNWIMNPPSSFCGDVNREVLSQVLNTYDLENSKLSRNGYYRWEIKYAPGELERIILKKAGIDFGKILSLEALERGVSGRIFRLRIAGTLKRMIVGKELEIRRWLSESHLPSSCFIASQGADGGWNIQGAGWGHGVGLCQIGAAAMALAGHNHIEILKHYYPHTIPMAMSLSHSHKGQKPMNSNTDNASEDVPVAT